MRPLARIRVPDGEVVELGHGDLIGRLESAALHLADPRVSEAHAMVSLRGASLQLLALRGRFTVNGAALTAVELVAGLAVQLARDLTLEVVDVTLPARVLGVRVAGMQLRVLAGVCSLFGPPKVELRAGYHAGALAHAWAHGPTLRLRVPDAADRVLALGDVAQVQGVSLEVVEMALHADGQYVTTARGAVATPLEIVARYESVHVHRDAWPSLVLTGISARIVTELVAFAAPVAWATVAREIWADEPLDEALRVKWDVSVGRLRKKLETAGIRPDLVRSDGRGNVELCLTGDDRVRDEA